MLCSHADDNSNQSSIADASPIKQENSSNSSPAPEPNAPVPSDGPEAKAAEAQADGKEHPGTEGTCHPEMGYRGAAAQPACSQTSLGCFKKALPCAKPRP